MNPKVLPTVMIVLSVAAAVCYVPTGNWRQVLYWAAAAALNFAVTW